MLHRGERTKPIKSSYTGRRLHEQTLNLSLRDHISRLSPRLHLVQLRNFRTSSVILTSFDIKSILPTHISDVLNRRILGGSKWNLGILRRFQNRPSFRSSSIRSKIFLSIFRTSIGCIGSKFTRVMILPSLSKTRKRKSPPAHHGGAQCAPQNLRLTQPPLQFWCFEAPSAFHHFHASARRECGDYIQRSIQRIKLRNPLPPCSDPTTPLDAASFQTQYAALTTA